MDKVLIIDKHPELCEKLLTLNGYEVGIARDGLVGFQKLIAEQDYDLVILDMDLPSLNGWSVLKLIRETPELQAIPVIVLTYDDNDEFLVKGLRCGADLYLNKPITHQSLIAHIESIARRLGSHSKPSPHMLDEQAMLLLTPRENEVLKLLAKGHSNNQISQDLVISTTTVKNHLSHIFRKIKVTNRTQAAFLAHRLIFLCCLFGKTALFISCP